MKKASQKTCFFYVVELRKSFLDKSVDGVELSWKWCRRFAANDVSSLCSEMMLLHFVPQWCDVCHPCPQTHHMRSIHHWRSQHHLPKANIIPKTTHFCRILSFFVGRGVRTWTLDMRFWRPPFYQLNYTPILRSSYENDLLYHIVLKKSIGYRRKFFKFKKKYRFYFRFAV